MDTLVLVVALAGFLLLIMLMTRPKERQQKPAPRWKGPQVQAAFDRSGQTPPLPAALASEQLWEKKVLTQLRGDRAAMNRLLTGKARRVPRASRAQLLEMIHAEYLRDQR